MLDKANNFGSCKKGIWHISFHQSFFMMYAVIMLLFFLSMFFLFDENFTILNFFTFLFSTILAFVGLNDFLKNGIGLFSVFNICFFGFLALNCFNLSGLQEQKEFVDFYYFFFGPLIFSFFLKKADSIKQSSFRKIKLFNRNTICFLLLLTFLVLQAYVFQTKGIRIFTNLLISGQSNEFTVGGISGLLVIIEWTLLMLLPSLDSQVLKFAIVATSVIVNILNANRTLFIRVVLYLIIFFIHTQRHMILKKKNLGKLFLLGAITILLFGLWGNYREETVYINSMYAYGSNRISELLISKTDNSIINWFYGYTALNYDVLKQTIIGTSPTYTLYSFMIPFIRLFGDSETAVEIASQITVNIDTHGISGFNAATFLSRPVAELGELYFFELIISGIIIVCLAWFCKKSNFIGGNLFLISLSALTFFGNYYNDITCFFAIVFGILISLVTDTDTAQ